MKKRKIAALLAAAWMLAGCAEPAADGPTEHVHTYESAVVAATMEAQGYTLHVCSECGDSYSDAYTDKLPVRKVGIYQLILWWSNASNADKEYPPVAS